MVLLSQWIYGDIVEYLKLSENVAYLSYVLVGKWTVIFSNIALSAYLILTMFRKEEKRDKNVKQKEKKSDQEMISVDTLSDRERSFLTRKLRSEAEILMDKK
jgi:energy-converting hydrogenase Eha subunit H